MLHELDDFIALCAKNSFQAVLGEKVYATHFQQAGKAEERLADFNQAIQNPEIGAIFASRGGYGLTPIIDSINWVAFQTNPKWLIGFSDFTPALAQANNLGIVAMHGPAARTLPKAHPDIQAYLWAMLQGNFQPLQWETTTHSGDFSVAGQLLGGNLCMLADSLGTHSGLKPKTDFILFIEEVGEAPYRIHRMLTHLKRAGILQNCKAIIVGDLDLSPVDIASFGLAPMDLICDALGSNIPVVMNFPAGHIDNNYPLLLGAEITLSCNGTRAMLSYQTTNTPPNV